MNIIPHTQQFKIPNVIAKFNKALPAEEKPGVPNKSHQRKLKDSIKQNDVTASQRHLSFKESTSNLQYPSNSATKQTRVMMLSQKSLVPNQRSEQYLTHSAVKQVAMHKPPLRTRQVPAQTSFAQQRGSLTQRTINQQTASQELTPETTSTYKSGIQGDKIIKKISTTGKRVAHNPNAVPLSSGLMKKHMQARFTPS